MFLIFVTLLRAFVCLFVGRTSNDGLVPDQLDLQVWETLLTGF